MRVILETDRLRLRELTEADADHIFRLNANPNVLAYIPDEPLLRNAAEGLAVLQTHTFPQYRDHGVGRWAVELRSDGTFLGWCGIKYLAATDEYDLGYRFSEEHWGHGYATEAARACVEWARQHLAGKRIMGAAMHGNLGSIRVLQKAGLRFEKNDGDVAIYVL